MPCYKTLPLSQAILGEAPLQDAVYVGGAVNKIFGVSGTYLLQFNASTGVREAQVRISSPANATCRLCYHAATGMIYASLWNEPNLAAFSVAHPNRDIYPINPATLAVGPRLGLAGVNAGFDYLQDDFNADMYPYWGPRWIGSSGNYLLVQWAETDPNYYYLIWINPTNLADRSTFFQDFTTKFQIEQIALTPTEIYVPNPDNNLIDFAIKKWLGGGDWDECNMTGGPIVDIPIACEYSDFDGLVYAVDGNGTLFRINDPVTDNFTRINLTGTIDPVPPSLIPVADACRLRYSYNNTLLYLPCMSRNSVLIYNQTTMKSLEVTGFENPIDIVEVTGANPKIFAVQNSPAQSLKEIV